MKQQKRHISLKDHPNINPEVKEKECIEELLRKGIPVVFFDRICLPESATQATVVQKRFYLIKM